MEKLLRVNLREGPMPNHTLLVKTSLYRKLLSESLDQSKKPRIVDLTCTISFILTLMKIKKSYVYYSMCKTHQKCHEDYIIKKCKENV